MSISIQKISTNLWFGHMAEQAADYYCSIFKNSKKGKTTYYPKAGFEIHKMPEGTVMTVEFELNGHPFVALNGGPLFKFNESVSFIVNCADQEEIDYYWEKLSHEGDPDAQQCGWLKDKYGLSWQVVPTIINEMASGDKEKNERVMEAMLKMKKMDIAALEKAYNGQ